MKNPALKSVALLLSVLAFACVARADSLTNNFDTSRDFLSAGILGETNWDGIYLITGDLPNSTGNGGTIQNTLIANANNTFPGFFTVRTTGGDWAGANDDGFYLWKLVRGDFDVSIQSAPPWAPVANQFGGLLARAWNTNNAGSPYTPTAANNVAESFVEIMRGQEFNISEFRISTNGTDFERGFTDLGGDPSSVGNGTNATRYYRIVRSQETNFMFFWRTNNTQDWTQLTNNAVPGTPGGVYVRPDLAGVPMQVGINHAMFANAQATAYFTDFELSGPNVTGVPATLPPAPSNIVTTDTNTGGSLTFSWTKGDPGDNSLVIVKRNGNIQVNPVQGLSYNASNFFGNATAQMGGGQFVVYNGSGNSVTVTNLGSLAFTYTVAVYEYTNTGSTLIYNTVAPTTNNFAGPGIITAAFLSVPQADIPVQGASKIGMIASFSTGETSDQSYNSSWLSSDPTIVSVDGAGTMSGVTNGTATITGTFGPFVINTNITVHTPVWNDDFTATNNYVANGLQGSTYDGLFMNFGDFPGQVAGGDGNGATVNLNSQISSTNGLSFSSLQSDWQGTADDGPFLFKIVPGSRNGISGDFTAVVQVFSMNTLANSSVGLMARLFNPTTAGPGPAGAENHLNYWKVQNGTTAVRRTLAGANATVTGAGPAGANALMLIQRTGSTNFYFFEKLNTNAAWTFVTNIVFANAAANAPMEVGIAQESRSGVNAVAVVRSFMLDAAGITSVTPPPPPATNASLTLNGDLSMTLNWVAADSLGNPVQSIAVMRANAPVTAQPSLGQPLTASSVFGTAASGLGAGNYVVFVSAPSPASTNNTVTVTGLAPGVTYYAAIYTFVGSGSTAVFNNVLPLAGATVNLADGIVIGVESGLPGGIPAGGIGQLLVNAVYTGGVRVDKSLQAIVISGDTNIIKTSGVILTGITNGVAPVTNSFGGFTNVASVTVRDPIFRDDFTNSWDYVVSGVGGTPYDGLYAPSAAGGNPIPGSPYVPAALSGTTVADANISSNNNLTITGAGDGWENAAVGGFFLYKFVPGDFQAAVRINTNDFLTVMGTIGNNGGLYAFNQPGILARGYGATNGTIGLPLGYVQTNAAGAYTAGEYWVDLTRFDEFNIGTYVRRNIDSGVSQNTQGDPADTNFWLLIIRTQGTNFNFFKRLHSSDAWRRVPNNTSYQLPQFAGRPMQVGLMAGPFTGGSGNPRTVHFEHYMLDYTGASALTITYDGAGNVTVGWGPDPIAVLESSTNLNSPVFWSTVGGTPALSTNGYSLTLPVGPNQQYFRLKH